MSKKGFFPFLKILIFTDFRAILSIFPYITLLNICFGRNKNLRKIAWLEISMNSCKYLIKIASID